MKEVTNEKHKLGVWVHLEQRRKLYYIVSHDVSKKLSFHRKVLKLV